MNDQFGFLRETNEKAKKAGIDKETGLKRTGLEDYLKVIFPKINDWVHDKPFNKIVNGKESKIRPDYLSEKLKIVVEFDGLQHYTKPNIIKKDAKNQKIYESFGYKVVRIPYFIQLTNSVVKTMFGVEVKQKLFDENVPSLGCNSNNSPAYLCHQGIRRMANDFLKYPQQYNVNMTYLKSIDKDKQYLVEYQLLEKEYNNIRKKLKS